MFSLCVDVQLIGLRLDPIGLRGPRLDIDFRALNNSTTKDTSNCFPVLSKEQFSRGLTLLCRRVHIDDIFIYARTMENHFVHIQAVLHKRAGKALVVTRKSRFVAIWWNANGTGPTTARSRPTPQTVKHVRSFINLSRFNQRVVKNFVDTTAALTFLLTKHHEVVIRGAKRLQKLVLRRLRITRHNISPRTSADALDATLSQPNCFGHLC